MTWTVPSLWASPSPDQCPRTPHRDELLQAALGENAEELRPQRPLGENGKHDALQDHGLGTLKHTVACRRLPGQPHARRQKPFHMSRPSTPTATL